MLFSSGLAPRVRRICLATYDLVGPIRNGGIGTANTALAETLAEDGHDVTILYMGGTYTEGTPIEEWIAHYAKLGIRLVPLPKMNHKLVGQDYLVRSYDAYLWLKQESFDIVHFHEWRAPGFHSICAKNLGLAFSETLFCVTAHSPYLWHMVNNREPPSSPPHLAIDFMERRSVAGAEVLFSPSHYMIEWMRSEGWELPEQVVVRQNLLRPLAGVDKNGHGAQKADSERISEIVFFGRLEARKGLLLFFSAIERLLRRGRRDFRVTFLGKEAPQGEPGNRSNLSKRTATWGIEVNLVTDRDARQAQEYLKGPGRLAVIPSLAENSPYTVLECLGAKIPFVASNVGGIPELIAKADHPQTLFAPQPASLEGLLLRRLEEASSGSTQRHADLAQSLAATKEAWLTWHRDVSLPKGEPPAAWSQARGEPPLVSVCLVHYNRPHFLAQALESLRAQDYPHFEVILVDDGSSEEKAQKALCDLEAEFVTRRWSIIRQDNQYLGAARNTAARHARGEYLLFMDDDNYAKPDELSRFVAAAEHSGADILTSHMDCFFDEERPGDATKKLEQWGPLGAALGLGVFENCFGDANALVRRNVFEAVGGFTEIYGVGHEDWEFFAKAVSQGYRLEVLPEPLFYYRVLPGSMLRRTALVENRFRSLAPYLEEAKPWLRQVLLLSLGQNLILQRPLEHGQEVSVVTDRHVLRLKDHVYNRLVPYPRVLNVMRRSVHMVMRLAGAGSPN